MRDLDDLFQALKGSAFRRRFHLGVADRSYVESKGMRAVLEHAHEIIARRLAPAHPAKDGKQTPLCGRRDPKIGRSSTPDVTLTR